MAWTSILTDQPLSYVWNNSCYRNSARETLARGTPVFYVPDNVNTSFTTGYGGPRYKYGYTYNNCPAPDNQYNGDCTWWCWGRVFETQGVRMSTLGNATNWYANYTGSKDTNANNIQPGDVICFSRDKGHVMFVEDVVGSTIYISQSAYSTRSLWDGYACRVTTYDKSDIYAGNSINMYKDISSSGYTVYVQGVIHTGGTPPTPPTPPTPTGLDPEIIVACKIAGKKKRMRIIIE